MFSSGRFGAAAQTCPMGSPCWHGGDTVGAAGPLASHPGAGKAPTHPGYPPWVLWSPSIMGRTRSLDVSRAPTDHLPSGLASPVICSGVMRLMSLNGDGMRRGRERSLAGPRLGTALGGCEGARWVTAGTRMDSVHLSVCLCWAAAGAPQRAPGSESGWLRSLVCCSGGLSALVVIGVSMYVWWWGVPMH